MAEIAYGYALECQLAKVMRTFTWTCPAWQQLITDQSPFHARQNKKKVIGTVAVAGGPLSRNGNGTGTGATTRPLSSAHLPGAPLLQSPGARRSRMWPTCESDSWIGLIPALTWLI